MILADTSVWVDHLGRGDPALAALLNAKRILMHPYVLGEIAMGSLRQRSTLLLRLRKMASALVAQPDGVLELIENRALHGRGIGYVDAHLLASTLITPDTWLWTRDKRLAEAAAELGVAAQPLN